MNNVGFQRPEIRKALGTDVPQIVALWQEHMRTTHVSAHATIMAEDVEHEIASRTFDEYVDDWRAQLANLARGIWVAHYSGRVIGFVRASRGLESTIENFCALETVYPLKNAEELFRRAVIFFTRPPIVITVPRHVRELVMFIEGQGFTERSPTEIPVGGKLLPALRLEKPARSINEMIDQGVSMNSKPTSFIGPRL